MVLQRIEADGSSTVGIVSVTARLETLPTVIGCLEVMESVSKVIPGFGGIVEGACGTLRKILSSAESANACRSECIALAEHTTLITCAIFNEVAASPSLAGNESVGDLLLALQKVKKSISRLQNISRVKYFVMQSHIKNELQRLRDSVSDACLAFG
ncbi:hypothetical protein BDZ89DRAFT_620394 [Hymenopellis radicata]|nr:hypothetical protein BDZ89DRAFT_620394 [Hymenopellis radicata]